ncbi:hypothetical protein CHISP_3630 [Chitinispirillum alkaliphilum]|nr:hypothetical protein CHISP_3630 [Chitinispirillum alkaliphilum]
MLSRIAWKLFDLIEKSRCGLRTVTGRREMVSSLLPVSDLFFFCVFYSHCLS